MSNFDSFYGWHDYYTIQTLHGMKILNPARVLGLNACFQEVLSFLGAPYDE